MARDFPALSKKFGVLVAAALLLAPQCSDARLMLTGDGQMPPTAIGRSSSTILIFTNDGQSDAVLEPMSSSSLGLKAPFALAGGSCASHANVPANGGTCTLIVTFTPTEVGFFRAGAQVKYNWRDSGVLARVIRASVSGSAPPPA